MLKEIRYPCKVVIDSEDYIMQTNCETGEVTSFCRVPSLSENMTLADISVFEGQNTSCLSDDGTFCFYSARRKKWLFNATE